MTSLLSFSWKRFGWIVWSYSVRFWRFLQMRFSYDIRKFRAPIMHSSNWRDVYNRLRISIRVPRQEILRRSFLHLSFQMDKEMIVSSSLYIIQYSSSFLERFHQSERRSNRRKKKWRLLQFQWNTSHRHIYLFSNDLICCSSLLFHWSL